MSRIRLALIAPLAMLLAPLAFAQAAPMMLPGDGTLLQINAHGESHRTPDVAEISAGVVTQNLNANVALRTNAERMTAVVASLKQAGVAERDIQTSSISLQPQYDYRDNKPRITGYQVTNTVSVHLRELAKTGDVLDALVKQGANQINGPTFSVDKPDAAMDEARTAAIKQARSRADLYATATGLKVRRIVSISEGGDMGQPRPMMMMRMADAAAAPASTPIAVGENTLGVDVNVVFELGQ
ncbi:MAG: SIMPL domain-containing protein [Lysobacteraceae bacterium]